MRATWDVALLLGGATACWVCGYASAARCKSSTGVQVAVDVAEPEVDTAVAPAPTPPAVLPCLRARRSIFPRDYAPDGSVSREIVHSLLAAAAWAPYHGPSPPWRFVVLGHTAMREMQRLTLRFYDESWQATGWACGTHGTEEQYQRWRAMTEEEIEGRWGGVSYMIAIVQRRQAGSKRMPEWEEAAATACAVQNMHIQASSIQGLACYWSSWHDAARDSDIMRSFLSMEVEDRCLGFFIVASHRRDRKARPDRRSRVVNGAWHEWRN